VRRRLVERAVVVGKGDTIKVDDLPFHVSSSQSVTSDGDNSMTAMEKKHIARVLNENNWNISKSALALEIDRVTLYNKINKYGLRNPYK